jgi:hypothetical protein
MTQNNTVVAVYGSHAETEDAIKDLQQYPVLI